MWWGRTDASRQSVGDARLQARGSDPSKGVPWGKMFRRRHTNLLVPPKQLELVDKALVALGTWVGKVWGLQYEAGLSATRKPWTPASSSRMRGLPGGNPALWQSQQGAGMGELLLQVQMSGNRLCKMPHAGTWSGDREAARAGRDYLEEAY